MEELFSDLCEFKLKYKEYIDIIDELIGKKSVLFGFCRVFYFFFFVMMEEFCFKFEMIIEDIFNEFGGI